MSSGEPTLPTVKEWRRTTGLASSMSRYSASEDVRVIDTARICRRRKRSRAYNINADMSTSPPAVAPNVTPHGCVGGGEDGGGDGNGANGGCGGCGGDCGGRAGGDTTPTKDIVTSKHRLLTQKSLRLKPLLARAVRVTIRRDCSVV